MTSYVLQLNIRMMKHNHEAEALLWDTLVEWCHARQLFIGGLPESAVIYAALLPFTTLQRKQLERLLDQRQDIAAYRLEVAELRALYSLGLKAACMEAISQMQRFLAERMTECADSLAALAHTFGMRWKASVLDGGRCLDLQSIPTQLRISISRVDGTPAHELDRYVGRSIGLGEIEELIPGWLGLRWCELDSIGDLSQGEWVADSRGWRINLCGEPGSGLEHREVMLRYMGIFTLVSLAGLEHGGPSWR
jgi:uncharacterized protein YceK